MRGCFQPNFANKTTGDDHFQTIFQIAPSPSLTFRGQLDFLNFLPIFYLSNLDYKNLAGFGSFWAELGLKNLWGSSQPPFHAGRVNRRRPKESYWKCSSRLKALHVDVTKIETIESAHEEISRILRKVEPEGGRSSQGDEVGGNTECYLKTSRFNEALPEGVLVPLISINIYIFIFVPLIPVIQKRCSLKHWKSMFRCSQKSKQMFPTSQKSFINVPWNHMLLYSAVRNIIANSCSYSSMITSLKPP